MKPRVAGLRTCINAVGAGRIRSHEDADNKKVAFRAAKKIADDFGTDYGGNGKMQFVCNGTGVSRV